MCQNDRGLKQTSWLAHPASVEVVSADPPGPCAQPSALVDSGSGHFPHWLPSGALLLPLSAVTITLGASSPVEDRMVPRMATADPREPVRSDCNMTDFAGEIKAINIKIERGGEQGLPEWQGLMT